MTALLVIGFIVTNDVSGFPSSRVTEKVIGGGEAQEIGITMYVGRGCRTWVETPTVYCTEVVAGVELMLTDLLVQSTVIVTDIVRYRPL